MKVKPQRITIDIGQKENQTAWVILGELGVRDLDIRVVQNGRPFNLSGIHMSLYSKTPLGNTTFTSINIVDAKRGYGFATIPKQISSQIGKSRCCITFIKNEELMLSFDFDIKINDSVFNEGPVVASDEFSSLVDALKGVGDLEANYVPRLTQLENGKTDKTTTNEIVSNINSQLAETNKQIEDVASLKYEIDVADTSFKSKQKVNVEKLKLVQAQKLSKLYHNLRKGVPVRFCHRGDSLTFGYDTSSTRITSYTFANGETYTFNQATTTYPEAMEDLLKKVYGTDKILHHINRGRGGDNAKGSLTRHNGKHNADCTLLMLGTNDSRNNSCDYVGNVEEYLRFMEQLIIQELSWNKCVVLLTSPIVKMMSDYDVDSFSNACKLLGAKWGIPVIDTQDLLTGYAEELWSDVTHFSSYGYSVLGTRVAAAFVGEGLLNINYVTSGSLFEASLMNMNSVYTNGDVTYSHSTATDSPPHNSMNGVSGYGFLYMFKNVNGRVFVSFYTEEDNIYLIPSIYIRANCGFRMLLDNGIKASENLLDSSVYNFATVSDKNANSFEMWAENEGTRLNKFICKNKLIEPLLIRNKGWHTIEFMGLVKSGTEGPINLMGIEFMSFNDMYIVHQHELLKPKKLYVAMNTGGGTIPRPSVGDVIELEDDIELYDTVYATTGGVTSGELIADTVRGFIGQNFRVGVDYINIRTKGNTFITLKIIGNKTLQFITVDDKYPMRDIFGIRRII